MRKKTLLSRMLLLAAVVLAGAGAAWAEDTTVSKTINELAEAYEWQVSSGNTINGLYTSFALDGNITISTSGSANCGSIWGTETYDWRLYRTANGDVTVTATNGCELKSVKFVFNVSNNGTLLDANDNSISSNVTTSVSGSSVTFTVGGGQSSTKKNGQVRITAIEVVYSKPNTSGEKDDAIIDVSDMSLVYGESYTLVYNDDYLTDGEITLVSSNPKVVEVDGKTIKAVAVGTATITASAAEGTEYKATTEDATFDVTVTEPKAKDAVPTGRDIVTTFKDKELNYEEGGIAWTINKDNIINQFSNDGRGVQFGAGKGEFTLTANVDNVVAISLVASSNGTASANTIAVTVGGNTFTVTDGNEEVETFKMPKENNQTVVFNGSGSGDIVISINDANKSVWIKSITVTTAATAPTVTLAASGYATYCSEYPIDLSKLDTDVARAWYVSAVNGESVTFEEITGAVASGTPFILYGKADAKVQLAYAESTTALEKENLLKGTLAPTYVATTVGTTTNYGLSNGSFVKISDGVVPANKAYLPVAGAGARQLHIVFGDETTGVNEVEDAGRMGEDRVFDMQGRRMASPALRKGLYIVNGKKMIVK